MCSETHIQENQSHNIAIQQNTHFMTSTIAHNSDSNIYMEPSTANGNCLSPPENHHHHYHQPNCQRTSSPLSTSSPALPNIPPPYLSTSQHQHAYQSVGEHQLSIPQYNHDHFLQIEEFLPLCDLLFNIISLAAYFCDVVFDSVTVYTLYLQKETLWFAITLFLVLFSALVSQILSLRWYTHKRKDKAVNLFEYQGICVLVTHVLLCGVLWRYFKLFIPVDLSSVKHEVRDLCMLRMVHAFCEAAPMLIIQVYLMWIKPTADDITDLNIISIFLSLFSLCWALASFSKNVRRQNMHKLVLTWLGVIFQFFWRLGSVTSRVVALTVYATFYGYWVFAVIVLHWFSMLLWILSPRNLFSGENMSFIKRMFYSCLVAWVYIFCYINMQEENSRNKMIAFYSTMFLENTLLLSVCIALGSGATPWYQDIAMLFVWGGFAFAMLFMILYYKFFHIRHLKHTLLASHYDPISYPASHCPEHGNQSYNDTIHTNSALSGRLSNPAGERKLPIITSMNSAPNGVITGIPGVFNCRLNPALKRKKKKPSSFIPPPHPTISPPNALNATLTTQSSSNNPGSLQSNKSVTKTTVTPKSAPVSSPTAFWKKSELSNGFLNSPPLPSTIASSPLTLPVRHPFTSTIAPSPIANFSDSHLLSNTPINHPASSPVPHTKDSESNSSSRVNIQQKLQEKKQQQFMQLKKIEEEIKQGKLKPHILDRIESPPIRAIPPQAKKQPWLDNSSNPPFVPMGNRGIHHYYYHPVYRRIKLRSQTPEVLLAPHYLDNSRVYYDYPSCVLPSIQSQLIRTPLEGSLEEEEDDDCNSKVGNNRACVGIEERNAKNMNVSKRDLKGHNQQNRFPSDIDSQVSLPRSYTLPREFQYCRGNGAVTNLNGAINGVGVRGVYKPCSRKPVPSDHFHAKVESNSSNDGDVDSDINQEDYFISQVPKIIRGPIHNVRTPAAPIRSRDYHHLHSRYKYKRHETPL